MATLQSLPQHTGHTYTDPQGAIDLLPAFQVALFVALWIAASATWSPRRLIIGLVVLAVSQLTVIVLLGELGQHLGFAPHVSLIRGLALGLPVVLMVLLEGGLAGPKPGPTVDTALPQPG